MSQSIRQLFLQELGGLDEVEVTRLRKMLPPVLNPVSQTPVDVIVAFSRFICKTVVSKLGGRQ